MQLLSIATIVTGGKAKIALGDALGEFLNWYGYRNVDARSSLKPIIITDEQFRVVKLEEIETDFLLLYVLTRGRFSLFPL